VRVDYLVCRGGRQEVFISICITQEGGKMSGGVQEDSRNTGGRGSRRMPVISVVWFLMTNVEWEGRSGERGIYII